MKKYEVTYYYTTSVKVVVEAENDHEAKELGRGMELDMGQVFENLEEDEWNTIAEEID